MRNIAILENIRSAYNVGNIFRTADALWWDVVVSWYTPTPANNIKVAKTSLGAEDNIERMRYADTHKACEELRAKWYEIIAAEIHERAISLDAFTQKEKPTYSAGKPLAVVFGNEVVGVEVETLDMVDDIVYIPMQWHKESLNVGQSAAIFMRELR